MIPLQLPQDCKGNKRGQDFFQTSCAPQDRYHPKDRTPSAISSSLQRKGVRQGKDTHERWGEDVYK